MGSSLWDHWPGGGGGPQPGGEDTLVLSCHPAMSPGQWSGQQHGLGSDLLWVDLFQPPRLFTAAPPALLRPPGPMQGPPLSPPMHRSPRWAPVVHQPPKQQGLGFSAEMNVCQLPPPFLLFLWFWKSLQSSPTQAPTLPPAAPSQAPELWELGQPHFKA